jgi:hypothetical protein
MRSTLSTDELRNLRIVAEDPFYWARVLVPEIKEREDEFYDLVDNMKRLWEQSKPARINLAFAIKWEPATLGSEMKTMDDLSILQRKQVEAHSSLIFEIDLAGRVVGEIDCEEEIDPISVNVLSKIRQIVIFWIGPELEIFCNGLPWTAKHKREILKDIKSKRRDQLLSMENYQEVLQLHFDQFVRDEATVDYWFERNKLLLPTPEKIFQKSLWRFLRDEVDCIADREPMFKDGSRCDVRIFVDDFDMYFVEIKWIGFSARRRKSTVIAKPATEFKVARAIDGAFQTKDYIEKNNNQYFDHRIRLGIYLVYDAYPKPRTPIDYGKEIRDCALLQICEFPLASQPPSKVTKGIAKRKGLI